MESEGQAIKVGMISVYTGTCALAPRIQLLDSPGRVRYNYIDALVDAARRSTCPR